MSPAAVLLELTRRCNRACLYCYNRDRAAPRPDDLAPARIEALLDRLCREPLPEVTLIGGEPLTVPALLDVVGRISGRGIRVGLSTNALGLAGRRLDELLAAGLAACEISLDALDPAVHQALTGAAGLDQVRRAVVDLVCAAVPVTVGAVLTRYNVAEVEALLRFCFAAGVGRVVLTQLAPVGRAPTAWADLALADGELRAAWTRADELGGALGLEVAVGLPVTPCRLDRSKFAHLRFETCRCGKDKWLVEPSGAVRPCELAPAAVGSVFESSFGELAQGEAVEAFRRFRPRPDCERCADEPTCGGGCRFLPLP